MVRRIGEVFDTENRPVRIGVDYDTVSVQVGGMEVLLTEDRAEAFAQFFVRACWQAAANAELMRAEAVPDA
jgi:hypothetical protein